MNEDQIGLPRFRFRDDLVHRKSGDDRAFHVKAVIDEPLAPEPRGRNSVAKLISVEAMNPRNRSEHLRRVSVQLRRTVDEDSQDRDCLPSEERIENARRLAAVIIRADRKKDANPLGHENQTCMMLTNAGQQIALAGVMSSARCCKHPNPTPSSPLGPAL